MSAPTNCCIAHHCAADAAPLTIEKFRGGMDHQVGAELERLLQRRRAKTIVDRQQDAALMRNGGDRANVGDHRKRIGRRLEEQQSRVRPDGVAPRGVVIRSDVRHFDAELHEVAIQQRDRRSEHTVRADDVVARLHERHAGRENRRHARTRRHARRAALHRGETLLEAAHGRIRKARIDVALVRLGESRRRLGGVPEHVARRRENRLGMLAFVRANLTCADRERGGMVIFHGSDW